MALVYLSLGSNMGDRLLALARANTWISEQIGAVVSFSSIYETEPWGFTTDNKFLNQVIAINNSLEPDKLMEELLYLESEMGRVRSAGYQSREIDADILLFEDIVLQNEHVQIPHPRLHLRKFVLAPLVEIAEDAYHPVFEKTASQLLSQCEDESVVELLIDKIQLPSLFKKVMNSTH